MVLDNALAGALSGLEAAPRLKELAPQSKIILFTAQADLQARADAEPAVDAFLLKTASVRLLPPAPRLTGVSTTSP
jgi:DNA-binding NarL/FixJ family response regulator